MTDGTANVEISNAGQDRLGALAAVFGRAFVDDPMMRWPMGVEQKPVERFSRCYALFLELVLEMGLVWEAGTGIGAAVWIPPGTFEGWGDHPWNQERIHKLTDDGGRRYDSFWRWVDSESPSEPLWQLDSIAVEPEAQGRGYGSTLIRHGLAMAAGDGVGAFLSTGNERNVLIYQRCGFRLLKDIQASGGGPRIWFMRWDP
jgi:GNAT superfamily N-acetyltransferase